MKGKGFQGIVGLKRNPNAWGGAAVAAGADDGLEVTNLGVVANREIIPDRSITGRVTTREGDKGNLMVNGPITLPLRYQGCGRLIAGLLGLAGVPSVVDTSGQKHVFKIKDATDGIYWSLAWEILKDATVYEVDFYKIRRLTLRATIPGRVEIEVDGIGFGFTDASAVNTTTTIDTVTQSAEKEIAQARQLVVRMNDQSGAGLAAGDAKFISAFELTLERPLETDFTTEFGDRTGEPMPPDGEGALWTPSGSMTFSNLDNGSGQNSPLVLKQLNRTVQKMDVALTGDGLAGAATEKFAHKLYLPMLVMGDGKPTLRQGRLGWTLPFTAHHASTIPTGFPAGYVDAVTWENVNKDANDPLA